MPRTQGVADTVWMTKREAAVYAHVSTRTIERAIAARELDASGGGRLSGTDVRIRRDRLDTWMTQRGEKGGGGTR